MIHILLCLAIVCVLGLGFAWLSDHPGGMVVTFDGYQYQVSLMVATLAVTAIVASMIFLWWLTKSIWNSPYAFARYVRSRRRERGYQALSTGMIAAGAGYAALARKKNKKAAKLIRSDQEPLINLLEVQVLLLEGDHHAARQKCEAMLDDPKMRLLGLRGLYLAAERLGDLVTAHHYARLAVDHAPQLAWATDATLEAKAMCGDLDGALALVEAQKTSRQVEPHIANNKRAVLLTAKAISLGDSDINATRKAALESNRLRPEFGPAALVAARALFRQNDMRKGSKVLEAAWKAEPLPEIADLYVHGRHGDAVLDRLALAKKLQSLRQNHPESSLAVARAALDAQDYKLARAEAEAAARMQPREGAYLLLADIEEAETGNHDKVRQWLKKAVRAPRDPTWVADGVASERWAPFSPVTGRLDAFEWRMPEERLGRLIEQDKELGKSVSINSIQAAQPVGDDIVDVELDAKDPDAKTPVRADKLETAKSAAALAQTVRDAVPDADDDHELLIRLPDDPGINHDKAKQKRRGKFRLF